MPTDTENLNVDISRAKQHITWNRYKRICGIGDFKKKSKLQRPNQEATWSINKLIFIIDYLKIDITKNNLGCHLE